MNKVITVLGVLSLLVMATPALADTAVTCDYPDHAIYNDSNSIKVGCISKGDWDSAIANQVNLSDVNNFVSILRGQRLLTTYGFEDSCPAWFPPSGCVIPKSIFVRFI